MKHQLRDRSPAWKFIEIKVVGMPDGVKDSVIRQQARPGHAFGKEAVDEAVWRIANIVDQKYPAWEFKMVELAPNRFNFVWTGRRVATPAQIEKAGAEKCES